LELNFDGRIDGTFVQDLPSQQLLEKKVIGRNALIGNNADEGPSFVPQNITSEGKLVAWLKLSFPSFTDDAIAGVLRNFPLPDGSVDGVGIPFATAGDAGPTALNQSIVATGQQQRANVCLKD
jgi:hypothetical protein